MNRSTFFKSLVTGLLAAPAVAKVIAETEPSPFTFRKVNEWQPAPRGWKPNPAWDNAQYEVDFWCSPESSKRLAGWSEDGWRYGLNNSPLRCTSDGHIIDAFIPA